MEGSPSCPDPSQLDARLVLAASLALKLFLQSSITLDSIEHCPTDKLIYSHLASPQDTRKEGRSLRKGVKEISEWVTRMCKLRAREVGWWWGVVESGVDAPLLRGRGGWSLVKAVE